VRLINNLQPQKRAGFFGIDLTSTEVKPSACIGLDERLNLTYSGHLYQDSDILRVASSYGFELVAIDAPLSLPEGLCCLEEVCSCQPKTGGKGRSCERELAKLGILCYFTTKKSIIKAMVYRGIRLKTELEAMGHEVIEVYPYASKVRLLGRVIPAKSKTAGLAFLKRNINGLLPNISAYVDRFDHHLCDATIAAYTAFLHQQGKTEPIGEAEEGAIYLPLVDSEH